MGQAVSVACHIHSEWSYDAKWSLAALAAEFGRRGYRVLMMTEHDRGFTEEKWRAYQAACAAVSTLELLVVPGIEYSDPSNTIHVLVWGCGEFLGENLATADLLRRVEQQGGAAVLAHPSRKGAWRLFDPDWASFLLGIELWNRKTDGWAPSAPALALLEETGLLRFAGLDFHDRRQFFPLVMQCRIRGEVSSDAVLSAFRTGQARAHALGWRVETLLNPAVSSALSTVERARRSLAAAVREFPRSRVRVRV